MTQRKVRTFLFEGKIRTIAEIEQEFLPGVPRGTIFSRLNVSGATTMAEYKEHLCRPLPKPGKAEASRQSMRELIPEPRFSRAVHDKAGEITGEKGCNYCRAMKPIEKLTRIKRGGGRVGLICDTCKAARDKVMSKDRNSTNRGGNNR